MTSRRKNRSDVDSLDLLLDALCNMFGGIIFIALLIVLLSSEASKPKEKNLPTAQESLETRVLKIEAKSLEEDLELALQNNELKRSDIYVALEILDQAKEQNAKSLLTLDKEGQIKEKTEKAEFQAQTELERLIILSEELKETLQSPNQDDIVEAISQEREAIKIIEQKINSIDQRRVLHARLPRERQTRLNIIWMIIENNKTYTVMPSNGGWDSYEKRDVSATKIGSSSYKFSTNTSGGFVIKSEVSKHPRFIEFIQKYPNNQYLIKMIVRKDSHEQFQKFKVAFINKGYSYNLVLDESPLILSTGNPDTSSQ